MDYSKLVSVSGMSGLFELLSSKAEGGVVRSLEDKTSKFVSSRIHNFSHLESIEVYTVKDNVNLVDIFTAMKESSEALPAENDPKAVKDYFSKVYPDMDFSRVYASDMKKMVKWFKQLQDNDVEIKLSEGPSMDESAAESNKSKGGETKSATVKSGPARKVNAPRKMV